MSKKFENTGYSFSWTQPYYGWTTPQVFQRIAVQEELDRLDAVDMLVDNMDHFPDAEEIISKVKASL